MEPVPTKSEPVELCGCAGFLLWFPPNLSCLQNNPPENNVEQFLPNLSCLQNNPPENNVDDLAGTCFILFSSGLFWDRFLLDLRSFFGTHFRYKLMYYYFYHRSNLRKIIQFLRKIECIEFECNQFVLVLPYRPGFKHHRGLSTRH